MVDAFKEREKGEEFRFEMEQELQFKAVARRNRLLGEWLAGKFGLASDETEAYVREVIASDLDETSIDDVVGKVMVDIEEHGAGITEEDVRAEMTRFSAEALEQVKASFKSDTV